jgi:hypothetical protein
MTWERDARLDKNGNLVLTPVVDLEVRLHFITEEA